MSYSLILAQIKATVESASGIGTVHDYERWANKHADFETLFKSGSKINGWFISREAIQDEWVTQLEILTTYTYVIKGFYSLDDSAASEKTFQALVDAVMNKLRAKVTYSDTTEKAEPPQARLIGSLTVFGIACHYCEIEVSADERLTITLAD